MSILALGRKQKKKREKEKILDQKNWKKAKKRKKNSRPKIKETRRNVQKGLLTRQYLNNTELSPNEQKEGKGTMT